MQQSQLRSRTALPSPQALAAYRAAAALNPSSRELADKVRLLQKLVARRQQREQGAPGRSTFTF